MVIPSRKATSARGRASTLGLALWLWGLSCCLGWLASEVHAQEAASSTQRGKLTLAYRAPAGCPPRDAFEARLEQRLRGAALATRRPVVLTVALSGRSLGGGPERQAPGAGFVGTISLSDGEGVLGPRAIEAPSCSEAVDALTFVAALLLDDRARATSEARSSSAPSPTSTRARSTSAARIPAVPARPRADQPAAPAESSQGVPSVREKPSATETSSESEPEASTDARGSSTSAQPPTPQPPAPSPPTVAPRESAPPSDREHAAPEPARVSPLRGSLSVSGLGVHGVAPSVRPGLGLAVGVDKPVGRAFALSLAVGLRATWPHQARSSEGNGTFFWWSSNLALCGAVTTAADAARFLLCGEVEAGQILARGQATDAPKHRQSTWLALGPAARASVRLLGRWRLVPGFGLLVPATQDRFVVGARELHRVSRLTFRGELAIAVEWP